MSAVEHRDRVRPTAAEAAVRHQESLERYADECLAAARATLAARRAAR